MEDPQFDEDFSDQGAEIQGILGLIKKLYSESISKDVFFIFLPQILIEMEYTA